MDSRRRLCAAHDAASAAATLRGSHALTVLLLDRDPDQLAALGVRVVSPRAIGASDVIFRAPRPTVAPGGLVRMLFGLGTSYVTQSAVEHSFALAQLSCCVEARAVLIEPVRAISGIANYPRRGCRHLPVSVKISLREGSNFWVADVIVPLESKSTRGASVLLTLSFVGLPLFYSEVTVAGHSHSQVCNHSRLCAGNAFEAAVTGNWHRLQNILHPTGWDLWFRGGCGESTEEMTHDVSESWSRIPVVGIFYAVATQKYCSQGSMTTILGCAASWGDSDIVSVLVDSGADVNASNEVRPILESMPPAV